MKKQEISMDEVALVTIVQSYHARSSCSKHFRIDVDDAVDDSLILSRHYNLCSFGKRAHFSHYLHSKLLTRDGPRINDKYLHCFLQKSSMISLGNYPPSIQKLLSKISSLERFEANHFRTWTCGC